MEKKIYFETKQQKIASGLVLPILAGGFYVLRDDRNHQGMPVEQPHDHHERAPFEGGTTYTMPDSGSNTASVNTFSSSLFEGWKNGGEWPVVERPNLYITVGSVKKK